MIRLFNTASLLTVLALTPGVALAQAHDHAAMAGHDHRAAPAASTSAAAPASAPSDVVVKVNGLVCDFCARSLEKTFMGTRKVARVAVDLNSKEVRIAFRPGQTIDDATIRKLVTNAGYAVVNGQRVRA